MPQPPKLLAVRVGRAGDLVMVTPALRGLLEAFPTGELHLLTSAEGARVMRGFDPRLTRIWTYTRRFPRSWLLQPRLLRSFIGEEYDRIYIFETKPLYQRWLGRTGAPCHVLAADAPETHYSERCLGLVGRSLAGPVRPGWIELPVTAEGKARAAALLSAHGLGPDTVLVGLHPTFSGSGLPFFRDRAGARHRVWPLDNFAVLARLLREQAAARGLSLAVVVDALPAEQRIIRPLVEASAGAVTLLCAPPDFQRYKALLARLDVLVSANTGPMHIAAAVGTPVVALFSQWSVADCGPYTDPARVAILRAEDTPHPERGLAAITPERVAERVWRMVAARSRKTDHNPSDTNS